MHKRFNLTYVGLCLLLVVAWLIYRPGLDGPFLFDDFANLPALGETGPIDNWPAFERYVTSGIADPTGRPVAMLTFLADAHDWPADPRSFKRTNLLIHLLNGALLFLLLRRLGRAMCKDGRIADRTDNAALLATGLWLLHPLFVSTTLYIVQREAMLPATCVLAGLLGALKGRELVGAGRGWAGVFLAGLSIAGMTFVGTLCKANGILLPAFLLIIEYGLLRDATPGGGRPARAYRHVLAACIVASAIVGAGLLYVGVDGVVRGISAHRPWTMAQRLLTEPRVIWDYLRLLWIPHAYTSGVFNDQVVPSTSLLHPWNTLPSLAGILGLAGMAYAVRRRAPTVTVAIAFFLVGHSIESSTIPLELYFEHRNYVPALLMFWPITLWLCGADRKKHETLSWLKARTALAIGSIAGLAWLTHANATLWGNSEQQARVWAALNPDSPRAQVYAAQADLLSGRPSSAFARLEPMLRAHPDQVQLALNVIASRCAMGALASNDLERARIALRTARDPGSLLVSWFGRAIDDSNGTPCKGLDLDALASLVDAGAANPWYPEGRRQDLDHIAGEIALRRHDAAGALTAFDRGLARDPRPGIALAQAAALGSAGHPAEGLRHLATFDTLSVAHKAPSGMPAVHAWVLARQDYWSRERKRVESALRQDLEKEDRNP